MRATPLHTHVTRCRSDDCMHVTTLYLFSPLPAWNCSVFGPCSRPMMARSRKTVHLGIISAGILMRTVVQFGLWQWWWWWWWQRRKMYAVSMRAVIVAVMTVVVLVVEVVDKWFCAGLCYETCAQRSVVRDLRQEIRVKRSVSTYRCYVTCVQRSVVRDLCHELCLERASGPASRCGKQNIHSSPDRAKVQGSKRSCSSPPSIPVVRPWLGHGSYSDHRTPL